MIINCQLSNNNIELSKLNKKPVDYMAGLRYLMMLLTILEVNQLRIIIYDLLQSILYICGYSVINFVL